MSERTDGQFPVNEKMHPVAEKDEQLSEQKTLELKRSSNFFPKLRRLLSGTLLAVGLTFAADEAHASRINPPPADTSPGTTRVVPTETPQPTNDTNHSPDSESEIIQTIEMTGTIRNLPNQENQEELQLIYPENIIDGERPLINEGESLNIFFGMKGDFPITEVRLPLENIFGEELAGDSMITIDTKLGAFLPGAKLLEIMTTRLDELGVVLDQTSVDYFNQLIAVTVKNDNGVTFINVTVPHKEIIFTTEDGSVKFNPAELFIEGTIIFDWRSQYDDASYLPETELTVSNLVLSNLQTGRELNVKNFEPKTPQTIFVEPGTSSTNRTRVITATPTPASQTEATPTATQEDTEPTATTIVARRRAGQVTPSARVLTPTPTAAIVENSVEASPEPDTTVVTVSPETTPTPLIIRSGSAQENTAGNQSTTEATSEWNKEWLADEAISLRTWWNDMVSKGYITVTSLAMQFGGQELNSYIDSSDLVPNPVDYRNKQKGFKGNCVNQLRELVSQGQGEIIVSQEAFNNIPGGADCQVFAK